MSVREPLIRLIDSRMDRGESEVICTCASPAYRWYDAALSTYLWVMDVDLAVDGSRPDSGTMIKAVPIADASHGAHKAGPGTKLRLRRLHRRRAYEIIGTASVVPGQIVVIEVTYSTTDYTVGTPVTFGSTWRPLTYAELGDPLLNGGFAYGSLPYGTIGKIDASGVVVYVYAP
jgi:hypothetical protein